MSWPFESWLQTAVRRFGMSPANFWNTDLRDWLVLMETTRVAGCGQTELGALMAAYPDEGSEHAE
jgi:hypothetical protein